MYFSAVLPAVQHAQNRVQRRVKRDASRKLWILRHWIGLDKRKMRVEARRSFNLYMRAKYGGRRPAEVAALIGLRLSQCPRVLLELKGQQLALKDLVKRKTKGAK